MKEKKKSNGFKIMGLCFSCNEPKQRSQQQQTHVHCQKYQQNQVPNHLHLRVSQHHVPQGGGRLSQVANQPAAKSTGKETCKVETHGNKKGTNILPSPKDVKELRQNPGYGNVDVFTFDEMKLATKYFRSNLILGEGGFGVVYKGVIDETVRLGYKSTVDVAIKQLNRKGFQGDKEWLTEVCYLGQLSHPNLVKLIGYCCEDEHRLLVYEYMTYGCLEKHLFRRMSSTLTWLRRIKIALDAAKGLAFLHGLEQPIIYRDLKTSNILLDSNFNAKLSDFGLVKEGPMGDQTHVSTRVMGTHGYAAPEYIMTGHLTTRSDVYGFGVMLLELLIGRKALDKSRPRREYNLVDWCRPLLNNNKKLLRILDARIDGQYSVRAMMRLANLAYRCLSQNPKCRPLMSQVVEILQAIYQQEANYEMPLLAPNEGGWTRYEASKETSDVQEKKIMSKVRRRSESENDYPFFDHSPDIRP